MLEQDPSVCPSAPPCEALGYTVSTFILNILMIDAKTILHANKSINNGLRHRAKQPPVRGSLRSGALTVTFEG